MAKPDLIKWVQDDDADKIADPGSTKKMNGFLYKEKPPFQFVNYLFNRMYKWFRGLQGGFYDVVVGSASQVTTGDATHTITQLDDTSVPAGARVLVLAGSYSLTSALTLSNDDISFDMENGATIDIRHDMTFSGDRVRANIFTAGAPAGGSVVVTGKGSVVHWNGILISYGVDVKTLSSAQTHGSGLNTTFRWTKGGVITSSNLAAGASEEIEVDSGIGETTQEMTIKINAAGDAASGHGKTEVLWRIRGNIGDHCVGYDVMDMIASGVSEPSTDTKIVFKLVNRHSAAQHITVFWRAFGTD